MSKRPLRQRAVSSNREMLYAYAKIHAQSNRAAAIGARGQYMPTESQAVEAQRLLAQHAVQMEDVDKEIKGLVVERDQQVQSVVEENEEQIKRLRTLVKEHRAALAAIEEQKNTRISAIKTQWKEKTGALHTKRNRIQELADEQHSLFAPVRRLPSEILVYIFEYFVREDGVPWTLALVSVVWSKVVFSTCSLWSKVHVGAEHMCTRTVNSSLRRLEAHLRRAGTRSLLDLRLVFNSKSGDITPTMNQFLKACKLIGGKDMLARWRSVTLIHTPSELTQEALEPLFAHPLPNLYSLSIESIPQSDILLTILLKMIDTSAKAFRILSVDQGIPIDLRGYPNTLKRVEVLWYRGEYGYHPALIRSLSLLQALEEVELPGCIVELRQTQDWMRSVKTATFFRLEIHSTSLFDPQKEYLLNLRQLSLIDCPPFSCRHPWVKTPNLRVLKVVGDLSVASSFDTPILDDLCLISRTPTRTRQSRKRENVTLKGLYNNSFEAPKIRHLRLETMAPTAEIIELLKKLPGLERLTIQECPSTMLSYHLFAALKEVVEDLVHADGPSQTKMAMCPTLQNLTIKDRCPSRPRPRLRPHLWEWVTEVVTVRRNLGERFEGVVFEM